MDDLEFLHQSFDQAPLVGESLFIKQLLKEIKNINNHALIVGSIGVGKNKIVHTIYELIGQNLEYVELNDQNFLPYVSEGIFLHVKNIRWNIETSEKIISIFKNPLPSRFVLIVTSLDNPNSKVADLFKFKIIVPDLKDRQEDIIPLAIHFAGDTEIEKNIVPMLKNYSWPGNIEELRQLVDQLVTKKITKESMPIFNLIPSMVGGLDLKEALDNMENFLILQALKNTGGNKNKAAKLLKINRTTLVEKIKRKQLNVSN